MTDLANRIERLSAAATREELRDGGRYFAETCDDLTRCRHGETGEYLHGKDGELIELLWNNRAALIAALNAQAEVEALRKQLPEEMQDCTIVFEECEKGHGHLRGTNWIKHPCQQCEVEALRARVAELEGALCRVAGKNDLSSAPDDELEAYARAALHECELIAREALEEQQP